MSTFVGSNSLSGTRDVDADFGIKMELSVKEDVSV